jgi:hypothetical protein
MLHASRSARSLADSSERGVSAESVDVGTMIGEGRDFGKFTRAIRERPSTRAESALVTKTGAPLGNAPKEYALWGGEVIADGALCRKKG